MKRIGTLSEIGAQAGDVVLEHMGSFCHEFTLSKADLLNYKTARYSLVSQSRDLPQAGPVRTVTRKEIVPGEYGDVSITQNGKIVAVVKQDPDRINAVLATLTEIRDALEQNQ